MEKNNFEKNMEEIFDLPPEIEAEEIIPESVKDIIPKNTDQTEDLEKDYKKARQNFNDLINKGAEAIDGILMVASEGQSPRAYEVASQLIKTVSDANKDLIDLHLKMKQIQESENVSRGPSTVNNSIFVGSTKELQELLKAKKKKQLEQLDQEDLGEDV